MSAEQSQPLSAEEYHQWHALKPEEVYRRYLAHRGTPIPTAVVQHHPDLGLIGIITNCQRQIPQELLVELNRRGQLHPYNVELVRSILKQEA